MKTKCCNALFELENAPIYWNNFNQVIQCHHCGEIWEPFKKLKTLQKENAKKDEIIAKLRGCVEFYAIHKNHIDDYGEEEYCEHGAFRRMGKKARKTLKELEGGE